MTHEKGAALCVAGAELLCLGAAAGAQTFLTGVRQVVAFVTARDQAGRLVGGLPRKPQPSDQQSESV